MKKILLIIALVLCIFQMVVLATDIDIGGAAIDRPNSISSGITHVLAYNPANATGVIDTIQLYVMSALSNCEIATFYETDSNVLSTRDTVTLGNLGAGLQTCTEDSGSNPISLNVQEGDYIGIYFSSGHLDQTAGIGTNNWEKSGDYIPCTNESFTSPYRRLFSLYGIGTTEVGIKWNDVTIRKWNGIPITIPLNTQ